MKNMTFEPLRWQEDPVRVTVFDDPDHPQAYFQVTAPRDMGRICKGRPVEELPRILTMMSPAHHLVSAMALDRLFGVEPPPMALNMRQALLQAHVFRHHLRKLYFLISSRQNPFQIHRKGGSRGALQLIPPHFLDEIMHHEALSQEAATILGGRCDHPLSAVTGGVSRFLKEDYYHRLSEIAQFCLAFANRLSEFFRDAVFGDGKLLDGSQNLQIEPMASLTLSEKDGDVVLTDRLGKEKDRFTPDMMFKKIDIYTASWTREPFACIQGSSENPGGKTGDMFHSEFPVPNPHFLFVGPLARLNSREALESSLAEEERQRLIEALGSFPHFGVVAAYWALVVELLQAAEKMNGLYVEEKLTGPAIRTIPSEIGEIGFAALESPQGLIYHHYRTDKRGIVEEIEILGTRTVNNALRCLLTQKAVESAPFREQAVKETQNRIEISLLPF